MRRVVFSASMDGISIERAVRDQEFNMASKHWHQECEIELLLEGSRELFIGNERYRMSKGSLAIIDSQQIHQTTVLKDAYHDRILLLLDKEKAQRRLAALGLDADAFFKKYEGIFQLSDQEMDRLRELFSKLEEEIEKKRSGYEMMAYMKIAEFMILIDRLTEGRSYSEIKTVKEKNPVVEEIVEYLRQDCTGVGSLEEVSKKFYIDKYYLSRLFKERTGFTVNEYIAIQRIRKAQLLMEDTELKVEEVARAVGYKNVPYFVKIFKKYEGLTPLRYRKMKNAYKNGLRDKSDA